MKIWHQFHVGLAPLPSLEIAVDYAEEKENLSGSENIKSYIPIKAYFNM